MSIYLAQCDIKPEQEDTKWKWDNLGGDPLKQDQIKLQKI